MNLMISKASLQSAPDTTAAKAPLDVLAYASRACALGQVLVARSAKGVCAILIGDDSRALAADLAARFPEAMLVSNEAAVRDEQAKVVRFAEAPATGLDLALDMRGTPFQRLVWEKLRTISAGRTVTYAELARWISPLASPRAVAGACAANPIALAIPCHRVVRADGGLAGYRWGLDRKRKLLDKEAMA